MNTRAYTQINKTRVPVLVPTLPNASFSGENVTMHLIVSMTRPRPRILVSRSRLRPRLNANNLRRFMD